MPPKHKVSIIACARWETQYIGEWLLYHRSIGFDHVYLYCNDEDPLALYGAVLPFCEGDAPFVTFRHYPFQGQQFYMYMHAMEHYKDESEWIAFLDIDEFLALTGVDDIKRYLATCPADWDCIHFNWSMFGNNSHNEPPTGSVLCNYTRREANLHQGTKTLTRSAKIDLSRIQEKLYFWHTWLNVMGPDFHGYNVIGDPIEAVRANDEGRQYLTAGEVQARIRRIAVVQHYGFKSRREFQRRFERGVLGDFHGQLGWKNMDDAGHGEAILANLNAVEDTYLADYWRRFLRACQDTRVIPRCHMPNVSVGKLADQSSISQWSSGATKQDDAGGAVNGRITGRAQFHTDRDAQPWWSVDLGEPHIVYEVRIFNRVDQPGLHGRLGRFVIEHSSNGADWQTVHENNGQTPVGGADGHPLIIKLRSAAVTRHVRIRCLDPTFLHLDQVEVYGVPAR